MKFRNLHAEEIECRVSTVSVKGCSLLLYKDARCDMNILDESVGALDWKREHTRDNKNCIVSIWDDKKNQWISKEDTGAESFTEKEKGLASDSFKRACFNWGIGRELYTAPFIWINANDVNLIDKGQKKSTYDKFKVTHIAYVDNVITELEIINTSKGNKIVYVLGNKKQVNNAIKNNHNNDAQYKQVYKELLNKGMNFFIKLGDSVEKAKETAKNQIEATNKLMKIDFVSYDWKNRKEYEKQYDLVLETEKENRDTGLPL